MSNPISNQAIPLSFDDQVAESADDQTSAEIASNVHKYNIDDQSQSPVAHHVHKENEPLPGARGSAPTFDYSPDAIAQAHIPNSELGSTPPAQPHQPETLHHSQSPNNFTAQERKNAPYVPQGSAPVAPYDRAVLESALANSTTKSQEFERNPLKTPETEQGQLPPSYTAAPPNPTRPGMPEGVESSYYDIDGQPKPPHTTGSDDTKPSFGDKVIGTTEKIAGKIIRNAELEEKGQNRAHGIDNSEFEATKN
jgi:hypothetical protein